MRKFLIYTTILTITVLLLICKFSIAQNKVDKAGLIKINLHSIYIYKGINEQTSGKRSLSGDYNDYLKDIIKDMYGVQTKQTNENTDGIEQNNQEDFTKENLNLGIENPYRVVARKIHLA